MANYGQNPDIIFQIRRMQEQIRRLLVRLPDEATTGTGGTRQYENWITMPPTVRLFPVGFVAEGFIIGVRWNVVAGSISLRFLHNGGIIHSPGTVGAGSNGFTFASPIATADGDELQPEITAVFSATAATMSYLWEAA